MASDVERRLRAVSAWMRDVLGNRYRAPQGTWRAFKREFCGNSLVLLHVYGVVGTRTIFDAENVKLLPSSARDHVTNFTLCLGMLSGEGVQLADFGRNPKDIADALWKATDSGMVASLCERLAWHALSTRLPSSTATSDFATFSETLVRALSAHLQDCPLVHTANIGAHHPHLVERMQGFIALDDLRSGDLMYALAFSNSPGDFDGKQFIGWDEEATQAHALDATSVFAGAPVLFDAPSEIGTAPDQVIAMWAATTLLAVLFPPSQSAQHLQRMEALERENATLHARYTEMQMRGDALLARIDALQEEVDTKTTALEHAEGMIPGGANGKAQSDELKASTRLHAQLIHAQEELVRITDEANTCRTNNTLITKTAVNDYETINRLHTELSGILAVAEKTLATTQGRLRTIRQSATLGMIVEQDPSRELALPDPPPATFPSLPDTYDVGLVVRLQTVPLLWAGVDDPVAMAAQAINANARHIQDTVRKSGGVQVPLHQVVPGADTSARVYTQQLILCKETADELAETIAANATAAAIATTATAAPTTAAPATAASATTSPRSPSSPQAPAVPAAATRTTQGESLAPRLQHMSGMVMGFLFASLDEAVVCALRLKLVIETREMNESVSHARVAPEFLRLRMALHGGRTHLSSSEGRQSVLAAAVLEGIAGSGQFLCSDVAAERIKALADSVVGEEAVVQLQSLGKRGSALLDEPLFVYLVNMRHSPWIFRSAGDDGQIIEAPPGDDRHAAAIAQHMHQQRSNVYHQLMRSVSRGTARLQDAVEKMRALLDELQPRVREQLTSMRMMQSTRAGQVEHVPMQVHLSLQRQHDSTRRDLRDLRDVTTALTEENARLSNTTQRATDLVSLLRAQVTELRRADTKTDSGSAVAQSLLNAARAKPGDERVQASLVQHIAVLEAQLQQARASGFLAARTHAPTHGTSKRLNATMPAGAAPFIGAFEDQPAARRAPLPSIGSSTPRRKRRLTGGGLPPSSLRPPAREEGSTSGERISPSRRLPHLRRAGQASRTRNTWSDGPPDQLYNSDHLSEASSSARRHKRLSGTPTTLWADDDDWLGDPAAEPRVHHRRQNSDGPIPKRPPMVRHSNTYHAPGMPRYDAERSRGSGPRGDRGHRGTAHRHRSSGSHTGEKQRSRGRTTGRSDSRNRQDKERRHKHKSKRKDKHTGKHKGKHKGKQKDKHKHRHKRKSHDQQPPSGPAIVAVSPETMSHSLSMALDGKPPHPAKVSAQNSARLLVGGGSGGGEDRRVNFAPITHTHSGGGSLSRQTSGTRTSSNSRSLSSLPSTGALTSHSSRDLLRSMSSTRSPMRSPEPSPVRIPSDGGRDGSFSSSSL